MYVVIAVLLVAAAVAVGIVPVLITIAGAVAISKLTKDATAEDKAKYLGIPLGVAGALALIMLLFGYRWYFIAGAPVFAIWAGTGDRWFGKMDGFRKAAGWCFLGVIVLGLVLRGISASTLKKNARTGEIIAAFKDERGVVTMDGYTHIKASEAKPLAERFPEPYLFAWKNAATGKNAGNAKVDVSGWNLSADGYCLTDAAADEIKTVLIAVKHYTVAKPVVTSRSGGKKFGYYKGDSDFNLYLFNLDTKEWTELTCVKNGVSSNYRGVKCRKGDAVRCVKELYGK